MKKTTFRFLLNHPQENIMFEIVIDPLYSYCIIRVTNLGWHIAPQKSILESSNQERFFSLKLSLKKLFSEFKPSIASVFMF